MPLVNIEFNIAGSRTLIVETLADNVSTDRNVRNYTNMNLIAKLGNIPFVRFVIAKALYP
jgi:hypothetical protein